MKIEKLALEANELLKNSLLKYKEKKVGLFFSGGVDCLWLFAIMSKIKFDNLHLIHFTPEEIDSSKIRDYNNVMKFIKITKQNVHIYNYRLFDENLHKNMKKNNDFHFFGTMVPHIINENLFSDFDILIRGEDKRIHTPFLRYSDFISHRRKFGLKYLKNTNQFKGQHIVTSLWNRILGCSNKEYIGKFNTIFDFKKMSYHEAHLKICKVMDVKQNLDDMRCGSLYNQREVLFPFQTIEFVKWSTKASKIICEYLKKISFNEFNNQKILVNTALKNLGINKNIINSKGTLETDHTQFKDFLHSKGYSNPDLNQAWIDYMENL